MSTKKVTVCDQCGKEKVTLHQPQDWMEVRMQPDLADQVESAPNDVHLCSLHCLRLFSRRLCRSVTDSGKGDGTNEE